MKLELYRDPTKDACTLGKLSINGVFECFTLERPISGAGIVAIPATGEGAYPVTLGWSAHFQRVVPHINNVPDRTEIEIHWGNWVTNTTGCVLVGEERGVFEIMNSGAAFDALFDKLREAAIQEAISIRVVNPTGGAS